MIPCHRALIVTCLGAATAGAPAVAQELEVEETSGVPVVDGTIEPGDIRFAVAGGVAYQFDASINGGGRLAVTRADFALGATVPLTEKLDLKIGFGYGLDSYDFSGDTSFPGGGGPWDDVHTMSTSPQLSLRLNPKWTIFGGPIFQSRREQGADYGDSWTYGGLVGALYRVDETLTLGLGVGGTTQIEDSARFFPVIVVDWEFSEGMKLTTLTLGGLSQWSGAEAVWTLSSQWEIAVGVRYSFNRFRLDDDAVAPGGVGQDTNVPMWFRATMMSGSKFRLNFWAGAAFSGELKLENQNGNGIKTEDYDPAFVMGVGATIRF